MNFNFIYNPTFLQIFLLVDVFVMGAIGAISIHHLISLVHARREAKFVAAHPIEPDKPHTPVETVKLSPIVKAKLLEVAQTNFQKILNKSADELQIDLKQTTAKLDQQLQRLGAEIIATEMKRYKNDIDKMRLTADTNLANAQTDINKHQTDLRAKLEARQTELETKLTADIKAEQDRLMAAIDTKLSDAVISFLIETLGHDVDLGAQSNYLIKTLEEHKDDFKKGLKDEA